MFESSLTRRTPAWIARDPFANFFDAFVNSGRETSTEGSTPADRAWAPLVDIRETEAAFHFTADLPGLDKEAIDVSIEDGVLSIAGERKHDEAKTAGSYRRVERSYGTFRRAFTLPRDVEADKIEATFENGVLELVVPKSEVARVRKISVN